MLDAKRQGVGSKRWRIGNAREFPELTGGEEVCVGLRPKLADALKRQRMRRNVLGDVF